MGANENQTKGTPPPPPPPPQEQWGARNKSNTPGPPQLVIYLHGIAFL
jgi:hypothetical protein